MSNIKKIILFINLVLICFATLSRNSFADYVNINGETYDVVVNKKLHVNIYANAGYSFSYVPFAKKEGIIDHYKKMLRNDQHGYHIGVGVIINKNWTLGVSFQHNIITTYDIDRMYVNTLKSVKSETFMTNIDAGVKMPFSFFNDRLNFYAIGGLNVIIASLQNDYLKNITSVPIDLAGVVTKPALGGNLGLAVRFNFLKFFYIGLEAKRLFIFTTNTSLIKDTWIMNGLFGVVF